MANNESASVPTMMQARMRIVAKQVMHDAKDDACAFLEALITAGVQRSKAKWFGPVIWSHLVFLISAYTSVSVPGHVIEFIVRESLRAGSRTDEVWRQCITPHREEAAELLCALERMLHSVLDEMARVCDADRVGDVASFVIGSTMDAMAYADQTAPPS
jgi:hypothetical protein